MQRVEAPIHLKVKGVCPPEDRNSLIFIHQIQSLLTLLVDYEAVH